MRDMGKLCSPTLFTSLLLSINHLWTPNASVSFLPHTGLNSSCLITSLLEYLQAVLELQHYRETGKRRPSFVLLQAGSTATWTNSTEGPTNQLGMSFISSPSSLLPQVSERENKVFATSWQTSEDVFLSSRKQPEIIFQSFPH